MDSTPDASKTGTRVWRFIVIALSACAAPYTPVSGGTTGWSSDRAFEIDVELRGSPEVPCGDRTVASTLVSRHWREQVDSLDQAGTPLFLDRARVTVDLDAPLRTGALCRQPYRVRVESFGTYDEIEAVGGRVEAYADEPFRRHDTATLQAAPPYASYVADGVLTVGAVFGQMNTDGLDDADEAYWSLEVFESYWRSHGLRCRWRPHASRLCEGHLGDIRVRIELVGPDLFGVRAPAVDKRLRLQGLIRDSDVVYVNGHAFQAGLDPLWDRTWYDDGRARLVVLDLCWASLTTVPTMRASLAGTTVVVISTPRRVVTGSVGSFVGLLDAVVDAAAAPSRGPCWGEVIFAMNEAAEARAGARYAKVDPTLQPAEVYGVSRMP